MSLIPRRRVEREVGSRREMDRLLEDFFANGIAGFFDRRPAIDVAETAEELIVKAELPGIDPKDIELSISGESLLIRAEKKEEKEEKGKTWHRTERRYGSFERTVPLHVAVDPERVEAESKEGVLTIRLPKTEAATTRRIEVRGSK